MGRISRRMWRRTGFLPAQLPAFVDPGSNASARDDVYDGPATLHAAGTDHRVRVRLTGHLDPIDGRYHWRGTVLDIDEVASGPATLTIESRTVDARITERTAQGTFSIAGVGTPPFPLDDIEVSLPA